MADKIAESAQDVAGSAATAVEGAVMDALGVRDAVEGARLEAERSGLPGVNEGGPGDAYRHLLISAESKRRFGSANADRFAAGHEIVNRITGSQTEADKQMDDRNNEIGVNAPDHETWEDVVQFR